VGVALVREVEVQLAVRLGRRLLEVSELDLGRRGALAVVALVVVEDADLALDVGVVAALGDLGASLVVTADKDEDEAREHGGREQRGDEVAGEQALALARARALLRGKALLAQALPLFTIARHPGARI
jgi:hypothetical protein